MNYLMEKARPIWKKLDNVFKFLIGISLIAVYFALVSAKAPETLANSANVLLFLIATLYIAWQAMQGYWQIQDIRFNYIMIKHLQHPLSENHNLRSILYLAIISDFDQLDEEYRAKLLTEKLESEAEMEEAEEHLREVLGYQQYLMTAYTVSCGSWNNWQTFCQGRIQRAINLDISFTESQRQILGELGKQVIKQRKKLVSLQKKTKWPKPDFNTFIHCLYHVIPKDIKGDALMEQSIERLHSDDFWTEYINKSMSLEIMQELGKFLQMIDLAYAKIKK